MSLYVRLLFGFLAAVLATVATQLLIISAEPDGRIAPRFLLVGGNLVRSQGETALAAWDRKDSPSALRALRAIEETGLQVWIVRGNDVLGTRPIPEDELQSARHGPSRSIGHLTEPIGGGRAMLVVTAVRFPLFAQTGRFLILLLIPSLVCLGLARWLALPIERLRDAASKFGGGNLSVRVGPVRGYREARELGRAFDTMAERVQGVVESQRRLLADVSHEIRSPLARIRLAAEMLGQDDLEKNRARIRRDVARLDELVETLSTVVRMDHAPIDRQLVDLGRLVSEIVEAALPEAERRNLRFEVLTEELVISADPRLAHSAIENLIRNALVYAPSGTSVEVFQKGGAVSVADRGPGVPEEAKEQIFEPFFRLDSARDSSLGGTGLGLAIVRRAARLHGGEAKAENRDGGGLIVSITFPHAP